MHRRPVPAQLAALCALFWVALSCTPASASSPDATVGVFRGAVGVDAVGAWEAWLGRPAHRVVDFLARESWAKIAAPTWWADGWGASAYRDRMVYSVPMLPDTASTLPGGAAGAYDHHFGQLARLLIARGQGSATIRLGWEFNGGWYRWNAALAPVSFVTYWRRIVSAMRRQPGAAFKFDWCLNLGRGTVAPDKVYPGDAYVDYIGADVYDHGWQPGYQDHTKRWQELVEQPYGLRWHRDFARAHGKPLSFPEWGAVSDPAGHGGGDNPHFIRAMHDWIASNNVAYHSYFEYDTDKPIRLMTGNFPAAAAEFRRLFGPAPTPSNPPRSTPKRPVRPRAKAKRRKCVRRVRWVKTRDGRRRICRKGREPASKKRRGKPRHSASPW